jgi:hypothetical protein
MAVVQMGNLLDGPSLTQQRAASAQYVTWIVAAILYIAVTYPYQAVVFPWLGSSPQIVYVVLCLVGMAMLSSFVTSGVVVEHRRTVIVAILVLTIPMLMTLAIYLNPTVIRDLLLVTLIVMVWFRTQGHANLQIMRALIYISVAALLLAILVVPMFYAHWIDWPTWSVDRLALDAANPVRTRQEYADADYYLPLWMALVPQVQVADQGFGVEFIRQPFVFTEPSGTWYYTASLFWLAVADSRLAWRKFCLVVLGIALVFSFSVAGILATIAAVLFCVAFAVGGRAVVLVIVAAAVALLAIVPIDQILALLGSNKSDQFSFYRDNVTVLTSLTWFGNSVSMDEQPRSYGLLVVLYRYGVVGAAALLLMIVLMTIASFRLLRDTYTLSWRRYPLFIGCFVALALLTKYPGIVPAVPAIVLAASISLRQTRTDPLSLTLLSRSPQR